MAQSVSKPEFFKLLSLASQLVKTSRRVSKRHDGCSGKKTRPSKSANTLAKQRYKGEYMYSAIADKIREGE